MSQIKEDVFNKNPMLVLSYLTKNPNRNNMATSVAKELTLSTGSVHAILKKFESSEIVESKHIGKSIIYNVNKNSPLIKSFRIFDNLLDIKELVDELKNHTRRIVLFGSCSRGEDNSESDIDLLIIADEEEKDIVLELTDKYTGDREINSIIIDELELIEMEKSDAIFYKEIIKGIELWEVSSEYNR